MDAFWDESELIIFDRADFKPGRSTNGPPFKLKVSEGKPDRSLTVSSVTVTRQPSTKLSAPADCFTIKNGKCNSLTAIIDANRCALMAAAISRTEFRVEMNTTRDATNTPKHCICEYKLSFQREEYFHNDKDILVLNSFSSNIVMPETRDLLGLGEKSRLALSGTRGCAAFPAPLFRLGDSGLRVAPDAASVAQLVDDLPPNCCSASSESPG